MGLNVLPQLALYFGDYASPELVAVKFCYPAIGIPARSCTRGRSHEPGTSGTFGWSAAVKALSVLILRSKLAAFAGRDTESTVLEGESGSLAASLDNSLSKRPQWMVDIFGLLPNGESVLFRCLKRINPERKRLGPVKLYWNTKFVPLATIEIFLDTQKLEGSAQIQKLLSKLEPSSVSSNDQISTQGSNLSIEVERMPRTADSTRIPTVVFVSPAVHGKPFYVEALDGLVYAARFESAEPFHIIPRMPRTHFSQSELQILIESLNDESPLPDGLIIILDDPQKRYADLVRLRESTQLPILLFDVNCTTEDTGGTPSIFPFVGGAEQIGGATAAEILADRFSKFQVTAPTVWLIQGTVTSWEGERAKGFSAKLIELLPGARIIQSPPLQYDRALARYATLEYLVQQSPQRFPDGIFACNDDMALGARKAVLRALELGKICPPHFGIVGYDGIREMKDRIDEGDHLISGTVDVKIGDQIRLCAQVMSRMLQKKIPVVSPQLVVPTAYVGNNDVIATARTRPASSAVRSS